MGKYTKKAKMTADVALTDVSQSYLGVRTHTKTLPLHRLPSAAAPPPDSCYLDLRSRRLQKHVQQPHNSRNTRRSCACAPKRGDEDSIEIDENNLDFDVRQRGGRESTPCSSTRGGADTLTKRPCSSGASQRVQNALVMNDPSARELEEFFTRQEHSMQRHFIQKYNFDIVRDLPQPGRYEWVAVRP